MVPFRALLVYKSQGQGRMPKAIAEAIEGGKALENFLI
ncbi:H-NS family nucleoid-associated regulatory protein [Aeromonas caviae]